MVVAADYLGLGSSAGRHPWLDSTTEMTATRDLLRATPDVLARLGQERPDGVDLVGFSQGAHATLALAGALDSGVRSVIGIGGPYLLDAVDVPALVAGRGGPRGSVAGPHAARAHRRDQGLRRERDVPTRCPRPGWL